MTTNGSSFRVGTDVVAVDEVTQSLRQFGGTYLARVYTAGEVDDCAGDPRRLAARFAAKEAVVKALSITGLATPFHEVEVVSAPDSPPTIELHGTLAAAARQQGWGAVSLSISHADCHAVATVVVAVSSPDSVTAPEPQ